MSLNRLWPIEGLFAIFVLLALSGFGCSPATAPSTTPDAGDAARSEPDATQADTAVPDAADDVGQPSWELPEGCNPYAYREDCLFPFPSDVFLVADSSTPSGRRIELGPAAQIDSSAGRVDPTRLRPIDGAPQHPGIFVYMRAGFADQFPGPDDAESIAPSGDAKTLLVEAATGRLVPHFAEVFEGWRDTRGKLLALRPLERLRPGTRYVVGLRDIEDLSGTPLEQPDGFRQMTQRELRGAPTTVVAETARLHDEVLSVLDRLGVAHADLLLAWDFTTATASNATSDLLSMREETVATLEATPPRVEVTRIREGEDLALALRPFVHRQVDGFLVGVPSFLEPVEEQRLDRGEAGIPRRTGDTRVAFTALIPRKVASDPDAPSRRIVQFGHGFFGSRHELDTNFQYVFAERLGFVIVAVDWWGFAQEDIANLVPRLSDNLADVFLFGDRLAQAMVNQIALEYAIRDALHSDPSMLVNGLPTYDPNQHYFYGVSAGGIFGATFAALSRFVTRFALSVGGSSFSLLMSRSDAFGPLSAILRQTISELGAHKIIALAPLALDFVDPVAWSDRVVASNKRVLMQVGLGDTAVPLLASELAARELEATLLAPSPRTTPLLAESDGPIDGNGLVVVDFGSSPTIGQDWKSITEDTPAHEGVRRFAPMMEQIDRFFAPDGRIEQTCSGPCIAGP